MSHFLDEIVRAQKRGERRGIPSICSAHPWVLKAAMSRAKTGTTSSRPGSEATKQQDGLVLIESTCNQVNQFGGYTGMTPADFAANVHAQALENGFPEGRLILGGDHLGPSPWQKEPAASAMKKAADMLRAYVQAGYTKIHLDASMKLGDDAPSHPLDVELVARRTAFLAGVAEATFAKVSKPSHELRYVIGSEVPTPGGATSHDEGIRVTKVGDARRTFEVMRIAFLRVGLDLAWGRVIALVVQPGVEFGNDFVLDYHPTAARHLVRFSETIPMVYEAHSTDYQTDKALQELVRDHFAILKVGPALTFAFREAIFALAWMENELVSSVERSRLIETLDKAVLRQPSYWKDHYLGTPSQIAFARKYSLSDRIRYYWSNPLVQSSLDRLFQNLEGKALPLTLLSQFMPVQSERIRSGQIANTLEALILDKIHTVLEEYTLACG